MSGVLFVVNVPHKDYESDLRKTSKPPIVVIEKDNYEKTSKLVDELKDNKRFGTIRTNLEVNSRESVSLAASTDRLNTSTIEIGLFKCSSDSKVNDLNAPAEKKNYLKTSWVEVKQAMKSKKSKLKITPHTGVDILSAFHWNTPLETILSEIIFRLKINNAAWNPSKDNNIWQVTFTLESSSLCEELLQVFRSFGIGRRFHSSVSVVPCALHYAASEDGEAQFASDVDSTWSKLSSSVRARTNLAQVLHDVRADATLTFDWLFLLVVAAFVAAIGLVENSTVILVASMLISPLMGPITAATLGTAVRDRSLQHMGLLHELLGLFLSLVIGFLFGLVICAVDEHYGVGEWPTYEITSRCEIRSLWVGVLVAIPSGAGVALAVLGDYTASLVGVAISASLLPPAVNAGLLWAMSLVHAIMGDENRWTAVVTTSQFSANHAAELAALGAVSLCLTLVNIVCIFLAGVAVYKVKEVYPVDQRPISWWRSNKSRHRSSKRNFQDPAQSWEVYNKWWDELPPEKPCLSKGPSGVQSDTVTFRRPAHAHAPSIEDYCNGKPLQTPIFSDFESSASRLYDSESQTSGDIDGNNADTISSPDTPHKETITKTDETDTNKCRKPSNFDTHYSFYNLGLEGLESYKKSVHNDSSTDSSPVLEPSLNMTIDPKKYGIFVSKQSYDV